MGIFKKWVERRELTYKNPSKIKTIKNAKRILTKTDAPGWRLSTFGISGQ